MLDRIRWYARGAPLGDDQLVTLVQHVERWRENVQGYELLVPRERAIGLQLYGELLILERIATRGAIPDNVARLLDALCELCGLVPGVTMTITTDDVVFAATPMGFERLARMPDDETPVRPENWLPVADVAPLAQPILSLAEEASRHALPVVTPEPPSTAFSFEDLDRDNDATAMRRAEGIGIRAATSAALLLVAALRDRPRSEEHQRVFDHAMTALGFAPTAGGAPTLVLLLEGARPESARERDWCRRVLETVEADARTRDDVAAVRAVLSEESTSLVLTLSAERRAQLLAYEAEDVEGARHTEAAARQWFANNRERLEELKKQSEPSA